LWKDLVKLPAALQPHKLARLLLRDPSITHHFAQTGSIFSDMTGFGVLKLLSCWVSGVFSEFGRTHPVAVVSGKP
jgi:hypothetical protein